MFEQITKDLTSDDLLGISQELTRRMRRHKPINPLNPRPQLEPTGIPDHLMAIADQMQAIIEAKFHTPIDQISDGAEEQVERELSIIRMERFRSSPKYDPERAQKLIEELINTVPYHRGVRYGKFEVIDGELVQVSRPGDAVKDFRTSDHR
ncbi:hypothetical protein HYR99_04850 [Candidatus Poribacteria bacterium]|nr:hypothetical protein [Candidatus Poribacteria bacterium]